MSVVEDFKKSKKHFKRFFIPKSSKIFEACFYHFLEHTEISESERTCYVKAMCDIKECLPYLGRFSREFRNIDFDIFS